MIAHTDVLDEIRRHGEDTYPEECCGFLLGRMGSASAPNNEVRKTLRAVNRNEHRRVDRYVIDPGDYLKAERQADEAGLDVVGIYHSHPDHPARPSQTDLETATFPGYTYIIVSVMDGAASDLTAWTLATDRSRFDSEDIRLPETAPRQKLTG